jgi:hypothetical protein
MSRRAERALLSAQGRDRWSPGESADEVARRWNMRAGRSYDPVPVDGDALERITRVLRLAGALLESAS